MKGKEEEEEEEHRVWMRAGTLTVDERYLHVLISSRALNPE